MWLLGLVMFLQRVSDSCNSCDIIKGTRLLARDDGKELWEGSQGDDKDDWESTRSALQT